MINKIIIYILFFNFLFNQTSSLSLYGLGERINSYDANSTSLGDLRLFSSNDMGFALASPSSYYRNNQANLSMTMSFDKIESRNFSELSSNNFTHMSFGFPVTDNYYILLSFNPIYRSTMNISQLNFDFYDAQSSNIDYTNDGVNDAYAYKTSYEFSGGLSEFSIALSSRINQSFSIGFKFGSLFGSSEKKRIKNNYKIYDNDGNITFPLLPQAELNVRNHEYSSNTYMIDLRFNRHNYEIVSYGNFSEKMMIKVDNDNFSRLTYNIDSFSEFGFGIKYAINQNSNYMFEFHHHKPIENGEKSIEVFYKPSLNINSYHMGYSYKFNQINSKKINSIDLNFGSFFKMLSKYSNIDIKDYGLSFGLGLNYLNNDSFNIGLKTGLRESEFNEFKDEKYVKLIFSVVSNNQWFINDRK